MDKRNLAYLGGIVFLLIGILGFFNDPVLGLFDVDTMHNLVHIGSGLLGLFLASRGHDSAVLYGKIMAVVYGLVTVVGFIQGEGQLLGLMAINTADHFLHLALTAYFAYIGFGPSSDTKVTVSSS